MTRYKKNCLPMLTDEKTYMRKGKKYNDTIITFDIETTSAWLANDNSIVIDDSKKSDSDFENLIPLSLCYLWQLSIDDTVFYGRELAETNLVFNELIEKANGAHIHIFVHNLAFEFAFLISYFTPKKIFARQARHPITVIFKEIDKIEFRCSYTLTRLSLDNWGKKIGYHKLTGTVNYNVLRTPRTRLDNKLLDYAEADCLVVYNGLKEYLQRYKHIERIPLTQTGEVRRDIKKVLNSKKHLDFVARLLPDDLEFYQILNKVFMGGYTHANYIYVDMVLGSTKNCVNAIKKEIRSYDFKSSYPYCMVADKYPNAPFYECVYSEKLAKTNRMAYILYLHIENFKPKTFNHYLSYSKVEKIKDFTLDNGRIMTAKEFNVYLTEQDFYILQKTAKFDYEIIKCWGASKGYLPKPLIEKALEYFENKEKLKGIDDALCMWSKERLNSMYGMMVSSILYDSVFFKPSSGDWGINEKTAQEVNDFLQDAKVNPSYKVFLSYAWGVWVTANARRHLWDCILYDEESVIYCDTDSIKTFSDKSFDWYNKLVDDNLKKASEVIGFDLKKTESKNCRLGYFVEEPSYSEFITQGSKRYAYRTVSDEQLHITVSGVPKKCVDELQDDISKFRDGFVFSRHNPNASNLLTYLYKESYMKGLIWKKGEYDEYISYEDCGVNLRKKDYNMGITADFLYLLESRKNSLSVLRGDNLL